MVWVRSEYAGELAVLSTWFSVLIPWNILFATAAGGTILYVRFPFLEIQYTYGVPFVRGMTLRNPIAAYRLQASHTVGSAYAVWLVGATLMLLAFVFSVYYYRNEAHAETTLGAPTSVLGGLLLTSGVVFGAATVLLAGGLFGIDLSIGGGLPGISVPVGVVFYLVFGVVLLRADRVS